MQQGTSLFLQQLQGLVLAGERIATTSIDRQLWACVFFVCCRFLPLCESSFSVYVNLALPYPIDITARTKG